MAETELCSNADKRLPEKRFAFWKALQQNRVTNCVKNAGPREQNNRSARFQRRIRN